MGPEMRVRAGIGTRRPAAPSCRRAAAGTARPTRVRTAAPTAGADLPAPNFPTACVFRGASPSRTRGRPRSLRACASASPRSSQAIGARRARAPAWPFLAHFEQLIQQPWPRAGAPTVSRRDAAPIEVSEAARAHLEYLRSRKGGGELLLRMGVRSGGCSGMSYVMDFDEPANIAPDDSGALSRPVVASPLLHSTCMRPCGSLREHRAYREKIRAASGATCVRLGRLDRDHAASLSSSVLVAAWRQS